MPLEHLRPHLADTPLKGAQMRSLITSGKQALEFAKDVCATSLWVCLHPGENLLPLPGERILAGPSPVQNTRTFLLLMGTLICFASSLQDQLCCACSEIKRYQRRGRRGLASGGSPGFTAQDGLLQLFHLLEEPKRVKRFRDSTQFLL